MKFILLIICCGGSLAASAQQQGMPEVLSLEDVVRISVEKSISARQAQTQRETKYWQWRSYLSNYQPQLSLNGTFPGYNKTYEQVLQPDGSILFQPIYNNNSTVSLSFSQSIAFTGGTISGTTVLQRFDDFDRKSTLYNAAPLGIGYSQPLWQFNSLRWDRRIEPLKYAESKEAFTESMEQISITACSDFFDLLLAQVNLENAESNLANTNRILAVADEKLELGKISRNEILQLKLEQLKARKAAGTAKRDIQIASLTLISFSGIDASREIRLVPPTPVIRMDISSEAVLNQAYANRADAISFQRRVEEAKRDIAKARGDNGLNAMLTARLGYSNSAPTIPDVYHNPQDQQLLQLDFVVPILDWGRSKSRIRTAEANLKLLEYTIAKDKQVFAQQIITQVSLFNMMKEQVALAAEADSIASEKYDIAKDRFMLGNLSIAELSITFQERDQARRDYITSLRDLWGAYYQIRDLSLYDFEKDERITYQ